MENVIYNHKSIRKYKPDLISTELLDKILTAGTRASTTGNMQVYSIIVNREENIKEKLFELHFKQKMVLEAPVLLTFCADFNRFSKWCLFRNARPCYDNFLSFFTAAIDALLVAQNVALAAESEGLGICYLGTTTYMASGIIELLQLPKLVVPVTTLTIGYPDENPCLTDRLPLDAVVHYENYCDYNKGSIDNLYAAKESLTQYLELIKINGTETLAQIFTEKRYTLKDNIFFSNEFLKILEQQGFMNNS